MRHPQITHLKLLLAMRLMKSVHWLSWIRNRVHSSRILLPYLDCQYRQSLYSITGFGYIPCYAYTTGSLFISSGDYLLIAALIIGLIGHFSRRSKPLWQNPLDEHRLRRVLLSLGTSILVTFAATFALNEFLGYPGTINEITTNAITASVGILFIAFLYSVFSVSMLQNGAQKTIAKVARNFFVAIAVALLTSLNLVDGWWALYSSLVNDLPLWTFVFFIAISAFSFDHARRNSTAFQTTDSCQFRLMKKGTMGKNPYSNYEARTLPVKSSLWCQEKPILGAPSMSSLSWPLT